MDQSRDEFLETFYRLWLDGLDEQQLKEELHLTDKQYLKYLPALFTYCKHHIKFETRDQLDAGRTPNLAKLTPYRREKFLEYMSLGLDFIKASSLLNVPIVTITEYWFKEDPMLKEEALMAVDKANAEVMMALKRKAIGTASEVVTETTTEGESVKEGKYSSTTTSTTKKKIAGDVAAQKFWLINRDPDKFTLDGEVNRQGNKGAIMEALSKIIGKVGDDDLDERFKEDGDE